MPNFWEATFFWIGWRLPQPDEGFRTWRRSQAAGPRGVLRTVLGLNFDKWVWGYVASGKWVGESRCLGRWLAGYGWLRRFFHRLRWRGERWVTKLPFFYYGKILYWGLIHDLAYIRQLKIFRKVPKIRIDENVKGVPFFDMGWCGGTNGLFYYYRGMISHFRVASGFL